MSEEEIIKNNELIAKFMGGRYKTNLPFTYIKSGWTNTPANSSNQIVQSHTFRYNSSWDWLMPVVEKIVNHINVNKITWLTRQETFGNLYSAISIVNLNNVYLAAIEFINWYNKNKLNETD